MPSIYISPVIANPTLPELQLQPRRRSALATPEAHHAPGGGSIGYHERDATLATIKCRVDVIGDVEFDIAKLADLGAEKWHRAVNRRAIVPGNRVFLPIVAGNIQLHRCGLAIGQALNC